MIRRLFVFFWALGVAAAIPCPTAAVASPTTTLVSVSYNYYDNYFTSIYTCTSWGKRITNPTDSSYIPGAIDFECHKEVDESGWSMDLYWMS